MKSKTNPMLHFGNSNADMNSEPLPLPVSLVVHGDDVHGDVVLLVRVEARDLHSHGGKHPPDRTEKNTSLKPSVSFSILLLCSANPEQVKKEKKTKKKTCQKLGLQI